MKKSTAVFQIACVYVGVILGAGFASGQEIVQFFAGYGNDGLKGLVLTGVLFGLAGWAVLGLTLRMNVKDGGELLSGIVGRRMGKCLELISVIFMCVLFFTMLSAGGAMAEEMLSIPKSIGIMLIAALCLITFIFDVKGLVYINVVLAPILVVGGLLIGVYSLIYDAQPVFASSSAFLNRPVLYGWVASSLLYVSYNYITAVYLLAELHERILSQSVARLAAWIGGGAMGLLGLSLGIPLIANYAEIRSLQLPLLKIVSDYGHMFKIIYAVVLLAAIFTTAIGNGFAVIRWLELRLNFKSKTIFVLCSVLLAHVPFSFFVGKIYPLFGYVGFFELLLVCIHAFLFKDKNSID